MYIQELAIPVINRTAGKYRQTPKANLIFDCGDDGGQFVFSLKNYIKKEQPKPPPQYKEPKRVATNIIIPNKFDFNPEMVFVQGGSFEREYIYKVEEKWGFLNMFSNTTEWCSDLFINFYRNHVGATMFAAKHDHRMCRDGDWEDVDSSCRIVAGRSGYQTQQDKATGFRLALSV